MTARQRRGIEACRYTVYIYLTEKGQHPPSSARLLCEKLYRQTGSAGRERLGEATLFTTTGGGCPFSIGYIFFAATPPPSYLPSPLLLLSLIHSSSPFYSSPPTSPLLPFFSSPSSTPPLPYTHPLLLLLSSPIPSLIPLLLNSPRTLYLSSSSSSPLPHLFLTSSSPLPLSSLFSHPSPPPLLFFVTLRFFL